MRVVRIGDKEVGNDRPVMIVAEAGVNHNGKLELAKKLVDAAKAAGADAVKFQTFVAEKVVSGLASKAAYQRETAKENESQLDMVRKLELPPQSFVEIARHAADQGIMFLSTPFDDASADLLEHIGVPAFKIGSGDITHLPFLSRIAKKKKPMIISTGMSTLEEVRSAVEAVRSCGNEDIVLTHCVSSYPAPPQEINLRAIGLLKTDLQLPVGYSDHTLGIEIAVASVAVGACLVEKHITLDKSLLGPDHKASLNPVEFTQMTNAIRLVEMALGEPIKQPAMCEKDVMAIARRSIVANQDIKKGEVLTREKIDFKRPATGLPPSSLSQVLGRRVGRAKKADEPIRKEDLI